MAGFLRDDLVDAAVDCPTNGLDGGQAKPSHSLTTSSSSSSLPYTQITKRPLEITLCLLRKQTTVT